MKPRSKSWLNLANLLKGSTLKTQKDEIQLSTTEMKKKITKMQNIEELNYNWVKSNPMKKGVSDWK